MVTQTTFFQVSLSVIFLLLKFKCVFSWNCGIRSQEVAQGFGFGEVGSWCLFFLIGLIVLCSLAFQGLVCQFGSPLAWVVVCLFSPFTYFLALFVYSVCTWCAFLCAFNILAYLPIKKIDIVSSNSNNLSIQEIWLSNKYDYIKKMFDSLFVLKKSQL